MALYTSIPTLMMLLPPRPSHTDIAFVAETNTLTITLPLETHHTNYYLMPDFATWQTSLLSTVSSYGHLPLVSSTIDTDTTINADSRSKLNVVIYISLPSPNSGVIKHTISNQRAQRSLLASLVRVLNGVNATAITTGKTENIAKIDVVLKITAPGTLDWSLIKLVAPFWGLNMGYAGYGGIGMERGHWRLFLKEGEARAVVVRYGGAGGWEARLRGEWRELVEKREL